MKDSIEKEHIWVDCYGRSFVNEIHVSVQDTDFSFIFDPANKKGKKFSLAVYLDHAVSGKDVTKYPVDRRICLLLESPIYDFIGDKTKFDRRFRKIFTHRKSLYDSSEKYAPLYYGTSWLDGVWERDYAKAKLISFVGSIDHQDEHGYALRRKVAEKCIQSQLIDCYGKGINPIESKITGLADYAFSVTMENIQEDFYFSEKLIDCFLTETVPIYWGCPGIGELFDERGMILFESLDELEGVLNNLSMDQYREMLPYVKKNKLIAIENNWHSLKGIYARLSDALIAEIAMLDLSLVKTRSKIESAMRRLLFLS